MKRVKGFLVVALGTLAFAATPAIASLGEASLGGYSTSISAACVSALCADSEHATVGDTVASTATFTNSTSKPTKATIVVTITDPSGALLAAYSQQVNVAPGKTWSRTASYVVSATDPLGVYTATTTIGGVSASATITVD
jgi:hypothetical protein